MVNNEFGSCLMRSLTGLKAHSSLSTRPVGQWYRYLHFTLRIHTPKDLHRPDALMWILRRRYRTLRYWETTVMCMGDLSQKQPCCNFRLSLVSKEMSQNPAFQKNWVRLLKQLVVCFRCICWALMYRETLLCSDINGQRIIRQNHLLFWELLWRIRIFGSLML